MLKNALLLFAAIVIVNILAKEFNPLNIANPLLNTFFWAVIISLIVGYFGFRDRDTIV